MHDPDNQGSRPTVPAPVPEPSPSEPDTTPRPILPTDPPLVPQEELDRIRKARPTPVSVPGPEKDP